jgi:hypothetical protein
MDIKKKIAIKTTNMKIYRIKKIIVDLYADKYK